MLTGMLTLTGNTVPEERKQALTGARTSASLRSLDFKTNALSTGPSQLYRDHNSQEMLYIAGVLPLTIL